MDTTVQEGDSHCSPKRRLVDDSQFNPFHSGSATHFEAVLTRHGNRVLETWRGLMAATVFGFRRHLLTYFEKKNELWSKESIGCRFP